jgi:MFS family permease
VTRAETRAAERIESDEGARAALQRRVLAVVVAGQVLGGAGLAAGITVGALLAQEMLGSDDLAGVPTALFTLGSALAAFLIGGITQRHGRRLGIGIGFAAGGFLVARQLDARVGARAGTDAAERAVPALGAGVVVGATVMVLTQIAMVAIMTMTPVHMRAHGHGLGEVGLVIGIHVGAMYLPSLLTGVFVDRVGRVPMAVAAGVTLLVAGVTAAWAPGDSLTLLIVALTLLGLGWNLGLIAGTALLIDGTVSENRAKVQGAVDVLIALGGAGGGALSGVVVAGAGFPVLALAGGLLAMLLVPALFRLRTVPGRG